MLKTAGIHHITAMVNDAQRNFDFYTGVLGLRLVNFTVDEPFNKLGQKLMLPSWLESKRAELEEALPSVEVRILEGDK